MSSGSEQAINIILLGDPTVGKTSLVNRFVNSTFSDTTQKTVRTVHLRSPNTTHTNTHTHTHSLDQRTTLDMKQKRNESF